MNETLSALKKTLPESILRQVAGQSCSSDRIGLSDSNVLLFEDCVLKITPCRREYDETVRVMRWLEGKLPAAKVLAYEKNEEYQYLLMSKVPGRMSCDEYHLEHPEELLKVLTEAFKMLWSVDVSSCPRRRDIDAMLAEARYRVDHNLIDIESAEPSTFGEGGFESPRALLEWLYENKPGYEPAFSHGDFCLPNIFIQDGKVSGFVDLDDAGIGDRWRDIATCYRSLKNNFNGFYGGKVYPDFDPDALFDALGIEPDRHKVRYHILLDELL